MNPEFPQNPREELELRVTSLLLGELSEAEAALVRDAIVNDPELQKLHDDLKQTIHLVQEATVSAGEVAHEESAPLRLSKKRRKKLRVAFLIPPLKPEHVQPEARREWLVPTTVAALVLVVGLGMWGMMSQTQRAFRTGSKGADSSPSLAWRTVQSTNYVPVDRFEPGQQYGAVVTVTAGGVASGPSLTAESFFASDRTVAATNATWSVGTSLRGFYDDNYASKSPAASGQDGAGANYVTLGASPSGPLRTPPSIDPESRRVFVTTNGTVQNFMADNSKTLSVTPGASVFYNENLSTKSRPTVSAQNGALANNQAIETLAPEPTLAPPPTEIVLPKSGDRDGDAVQLADNNGGRASNDFFTSEGHGVGEAGDFRFYTDKNQNNRVDGSGSVLVGGVASVAGNVADAPITNMIIGDPEWVGILERPDKPHSPSNKFVARWAFDATRSGKALDVDRLYAQTKQTADGSSAEEAKTPSGQDAEKVPVLGDMPSVGRLFRTESNFGLASEEVTIDGKKYKREFAGYEDAGGFVPQAQSGSDGSNAGLPITASLPTPHYRLKPVEAAPEPATPSSGNQSDLALNKSGSGTLDQGIANLYYNERLPAFQGAVAKTEAAPAETTASAIQNGKLLFENGKYDEAEAELKKALKADPGNYPAAYYSSLIKEKRDTDATMNRAIQTKERIAQVEKAWEMPTSRERLPVPNPYAHTNVVATSQDRQAILKKLDRIRLNSVQYDGLPLSEVIRNLSEESKRNDPDKKGINFTIAPGAERFVAGTAITNGLDPVTGLPPAGDTNLPPSSDLNAVSVKMYSPVSNIKLQHLLEIITKSADHPLKYSIEENGIVFSPRDAEKAPLYTRSFKVDPNTFWAGLQNVEGISVSNSSSGVGGGPTAAIPRVSVVGGGRGGGGDVQNSGGGLPFITQQQTVPSVQSATRDFFKSVGVDLNASGKAVFFNDRQGTLFVRGTLQDLDVIDQAVKVLNTAPSQVNVAAKFAETTARTNLIDAPLPRKPATNAPIPQPEIQTSENNFSTFSLNVSDVSFKLAAASLEKGQMPDSASIRSEEFINAFDYRDPEATAGSPVAFAWERARYPFAHNRDLLRFSLKTAAAGRQAGRPLNIVLLLDNSGSMERADRVGIIREALRVLASQLQPQDKLSVITFARTPRLVADGIAGDKAGEVAEQVSGLTPEGGTNLEDAMNLAYQTAAKHFLANGINRVVLLTDGAANLGDVEPESLKQKVEKQRQQGIALDCFGIGWEGFNDDLLEVLSRNGDGRYGFINSPEEAATEFAGQLAGALKVAASDVKVQVEFNPKRVTSYRQIGYAKHQLTKEQFRDNSVDAAEIAAQEAGNALYTVEVNPSGEGPLGTVHVRYKIPGTTDYREQAWEVPFNGNATAVEQASPAMRLATSASAFSEWLAVSPHAGEVRPDALLNILNGVPEAFGADSRPKKLEWMIRQAKSLEGK